MHGEHAGGDVIGPVALVRLLPQVLVHTEVAVEGQGCAACVCAQGGLAQLRDVQPGNGQVDADGPSRLDLLHISADMILHDAGTEVVQREFKSKQAQPVPISAMFGQLGKGPCQRASEIQHLKSATKAAAPICNNDTSPGSSKHNLLLQLYPAFFLWLLQLPNLPVSTNIRVGTVIHS